MLKIKNSLKNNLPPIIVSFFCFFLFLDGFLTYFHQDDFIQMFYSQNLKQVFDAFNIFHKSEFAFYRPVPTQLYFFVLKLFFGWNPLGYHVVNFLLFTANVFLVYYFVKLLTNKKTAAISAVFFAVNTTHFAPLHAASYSHELFLVFFSLLTTFSFAKYLKTRRSKNLIFSILFFLGALMSKETAVVIPGLIAIEYLFFSPKKTLGELMKIVGMFSGILVFYLFFHYFFYGMPESSSYKLIIGKENLKMYFWYFIWGLSAPNILIDFLEPGLKIRSVFFDITRINGYVFFVGFFMLIGFLGVLFVINLFRNKENHKVIIFSVLWFFLSLIPLVVFPLHKLAIEQALAIVGLSLFIGVLLSQFSKKVTFCFIFLYILIAINSTLIARKTHWIIRSSIQAKNTVYKIQSLDFKNNSTIYFKNGTVAIPEYGSAKQIYLATGNAKMFPLLFKISLKNVFFEQIKPLPIFLERKVIKIDSSELLGY